MHCDVVKNGCALLAGSVFMACMITLPGTSPADELQPKSGTAAISENTEGRPLSGDASALQARFRKQSDGTVIDSSSGLMWQAVDGGEMTLPQARKYATDLVLGGHDDWRLPLSMELLCLMDHRRHGPAMNTEIFALSDAKYWWTDTARSDDSSKVWLVNAGGGIGAHAITETISAGGDRAVHVRCVRGESAWEKGPKLRANKDGTVTDEVTELVWQAVVSKNPLTWQEAVNYCDTLELAGHSDWRLPTIRELRSLSDDRIAQPSIAPDTFPEAGIGEWWSATVQANRPERAWYMDSRTGLVTYRDRTETLRVMAVRGGGLLTAEPFDELNSSENSSNPGPKKPKPSEPRKKKRPQR